MIKHTDSLIMDILFRAENALVECESAYAVLNMWIHVSPAAKSIMKKRVRLARL